MNDNFLFEIQLVNLSLNTNHSNQNSIPMNYTLDKLETLILSNGRSYFDYLSHEFKNLDINKKLLNLALYQDAGGSLHELLARYRNSKNEMHVSAMKDTLIMLLNFLREEDYITGLESILSENLTESQLIELLSFELKSRLENDFSSGSNIKAIRTGGFDPELFVKDKSKEDAIRSYILGEHEGKLDLNNFD